MKNTPKNKIVLTAVLCSLFVLALPALALDNPNEKNSPPASKISLTKHTINLNGNALNYTAYAGFLPVLDDANNAEANMFFIAYFKDREELSQRPIIFAFNGEICKVPAIKATQTQRGSKPQFLLLIL